MKVKRYRANNMAEAIALVKSDLGSDAVILSTKTIKTGWGSFRKPVLEVAAAMPAARPAPVNKKLAAPAKSAAAAYAGVERAVAGDQNTEPDQPALDALAGATESEASLSSLRAEVKALREKVERVARDLPARDLLDEVKVVNDEIMELRKMIRSPRTNAALAQEDAPGLDARGSEALAVPADLAGELAGVRALFGRLARDHEASLGQGARGQLVDLRHMLDALLAGWRSRVALPADGHAGMLARKLLAAGVPSELAWRLVGEVVEILEEKNLPIQRYGADLLATVLMDKVKVTGDPWAEARRGRAVALVGPTGVGKTTTIAKLAAQQVFDARRKIALVTLDTYRVGAVDQLRAFASILSCPCDVAYNESEFENLLQVHADKDMILVDTIGVSQRDDGMLLDLARIFHGAGGVETHLILAATIREAEARQALEKFGEMRLASLILSKLDETVGFGGLLGVLLETDLRLSFFTVGQKVPEDIELATPERVADLILRLSAEGN